MMRTRKRIVIIAVGLGALMAVLAFAVMFPFTIFWPALHGDAIDQAARRFKIDPMLITAIIKAESNFSRTARSARGAVGLMQIMPATGRELADELNMRGFTDESLEDPATNIALGTYYIAKLIAQCNGSIVLALASYNAGIGTVQGWYRENPLLIWDTDDIPYRETRHYVNDVKRTYAWLKRIGKLKELLHLGGR